MAAEYINIKGNSSVIFDYNYYGIVKKNNECIIIDTGLSKSSAKSIIKILKQQELIPVAIINTHSHADHCGGNFVFQNTLDIPIYASKHEKAIIECPEIQAFYMYGASPIKGLASKFTQAKASHDVQVLSLGKNTIADIEFKVIDLKGHSMAQIGILSCDNVLYGGDALTTEFVWNKYHLPYFYDINESILSIKRIVKSNIDFYVGIHTGIDNNIDKLCDINLHEIQGLVNQIVQMIGDRKMTREEIFWELFNDLGADESVMQVYLLLPSLAAFLTYIVDLELLDMIFYNGRLVFVTL